MRLKVAPFGHLAIDDERNIASVNNEALRLLSYKEEELQGRGVAVLLPPASRVLFHTHLYPTLASGGRVEELYTLLRRKDGESIPVLLAASRAVQDGRALTELAFLAVRRRSLFERHLQQLDTFREDSTTRASNASAGRMFTLGLLLAGIIHEIRNPLSFLLGNLTLMSEELEEARDSPVNAQLLRECLVDAQEGAALILGLVQAVGMVSRTDSGQLHPVAVDRVVQTAAKLVRYRLRDAAILEIHGPEPGPFVIADEARLAQVVMNLLINAGQALAACPPEKPTISVRYGQTERTVVIDVCDNGPGVPESLHEQIFKPFYTTKPTGEGTGLGLSLSREIVASFDGTLELASSSGAGASFRISLPLAQTSRSADSQRLD